MNKPFEPGDIALLVKTTFGANVGKQVELLRCTTELEINLQPHCYGWTLNPLGVKCWVVRCESMFTIMDMLGNEYQAEFGACPESWLMPLLGDTEPDTQILNIEVPTEEAIPA